MAEDEEQNKFPSSLYTKGTSLLEFNLAAALQNLYAQTDYLKRHQDRRDSSTDACLVDLRAQVESLGQCLSSSSSEAKSTKPVSERVEVPAEPAVAKPMAIPSAVTDMMKQSEMKIARLESILHSLQERIIKQDEEAESRMRELASTVSQSRKDRSEDLATIADLSGRLQRCEEFIAATHADIRGMEASTRKEIAEVSRDISGFSALNKRLSESTHLLEGRLALAESQIRTTFETMEDISLQTRASQATFDELSHQLEKMGTDKASRKELSYKADLSLIMTKVDISEVSKYEDAISELQRNLTAVRLECQETTGAMERMFMKKQESVAMWCVRKIRKELAQEENGNADIGRVKCLICDQVVKQAKEQELVASGPVYSNTMRPRRQQSAGHRRRGEGSPVAAHTSPATEDRASKDKKSHDVKLTPIPREAAKQGKALSQAGEWSTQPKEREYVPISANPNPNLNSKKAMSAKETQSQGYFKDLEMKFARGDYVRAARPLSAV